MKKKLLALVLSVVMLVSLLVPMFAISASTNPTITVSLGAPQYMDLGNGTGLLAVPVNVSENTSDLFVIKYRVMSKDGLDLMEEFENGTFQEVYYDFLNRPKYITLSATTVKNADVIVEKGYTGMQVVQDSSSGTDGINTESGNLGVVYFVAPTEPGTYTFTVETEGCNDVTVDENGEKVVGEYTVTLGEDVTYTVGAAACEHTNTTETVVDATCTEKGSKTVVCDDCGETVSTEEIAALGHTEKETVVDATCGVAGSKTVTCEVCGETISTEEIPATGEHNYGVDADHEDAKAPTCTETGVEVSVCSVCGDVRKTDLAALGHTEGEPVRVEPTETEDGSITVSCTVCGEVISTEILPATGGSEEPAGPSITVSLGAPQYMDLGNGTGLLAVPVNVSKNTSDLFVIKYRVMSKDGLDLMEEFENGTFEEVYYDFLNRPQKITLSATTVKNASEITSQGYTGMQVVQDSSSGTDGINTESGNLGVVYFIAPTNVGTYTFTIETEGCNDVTVDENGEKVVGEYTVTLGEDVTYTVECSNHENETVTVDPTCSKDGSVTVKCKHCGKVESTEVLPATGEHNYGVDADHEDAKAPTCTETGVEVSVCSGCGDVRKTELAALGHTEGTPVRVEPTCTEKGSVTVKCTVCGETISTEEIAALGHTEGTPVRVEPTCTEKGSVTVKCTVCGETISTEELAALGHTEGTPVRVEPTCTEKGSITVKCTVCGETISTEEIAALGHTEGTPVRVEPTCTEKGSVTVKCTVCDETISTQEIAALGHTEKETVVDATCTEKGSKTVTCEVCGETISTEEIAALGHDLGEKEVVTPATAEAEGKWEQKCSRCDHKVEGKIAKLATEIKNDKVEIKSDKAELPEDLEIKVGDAKKGDDGKMKKEITFESKFVPGIKGKVTVTYAAPEGENFQVVVVKADGTTAVVESKVVDGKIVFEAELDGKYELVYTEVKAPEKDETPKTPDTGDAMNIAIVVLVALAAVAGIVVVGKKRIAL